MNPPAFSLDDVDPIGEILNSREFAACADFFSKSPALERALVPAEAQALLHLLVRHMKPENVVEIGSYRISTTEALARAMHANGAGLVHTIDPFGQETVPPLLAAWPDDLRSHVQFHPVNSMDFFAAAARNGLQVGLIFVDGNHDYEFALFDILSAARFLSPGGLIVVDNISQPGPYYAILEFLAGNPGWRQLGRPLPDPHATPPFDRHRPGITNTDFAIVQAPRSVLIGARALTSGYVFYPREVLNGVRLTLAGEANGGLYIQFIMRSFVPIPSETILEQSVDLNAAVGEVELRLGEPFRWVSNRASTAEPWFAWKGEKPLRLTRAPELF
jgi:predicted O-methyltransferase YrrM